MVSAINAALSGFQAATARIAVSASNIANADSTSTTIPDGTTSNTPYTPQQVVQSSRPGGGVTTSIEPVTPSSISVNDPNNPGSQTQVPNVDQAQQLLQANIATYDAKANLTVIKAQEKLFQSVLNIVS